MLLLVVTAVPQPLADPEQGFTIQPAQGWSQVQPSETPPPRMKLQSSSGHSAGVLYVRISDAGTETLDSWSRRTRNHATEELRGKVLLDDQTTVSGFPARKILYTGQAELGDSDIEAGHYSLGVIANGKLYVVYGLATQENFDQYWDDIRAMGATFELLPVN